MWHLDPNHMCEGSHHSYAAEECEIVTEFTQGQSFEQGLWSVNGDWSVESCFGQDFVGRFDQDTVTRDINNIPEHSYLRISFDAYIIDSWDNEDIQIYLDNVMVWRKRETYNYPGSSNVCHSGWNDHHTVIDIILEHSGATASIRLDSTLNQHRNDESWGFSDFHVSALDENRDCPSAYNVCGEEDLPEDNVCADAGGGWVHVRHVTAG